MIDLMDPKFKTSIKIIGLFCILVAAFLYAELRHIEGRRIQCFEDGGFLFRDDKGFYICESVENIKDKGYIINDYKSLSKLPANYNNSVNLEWNLGNGSQKQ